MKITRTVDPVTGATTEKIELTGLEVAALEDAHAIIKKRAEAENAKYDREMTEWWLMGLLRREGIDKMLEIAKTAPFQRTGPKYRVGYSYSFV